MKQLTRSFNYKSIAALFMFCLVQAVAFAQDSSGGGSSSSSTTTTTTQTWYAQPWVWVVGGIVLILILVALFRGGGNSGSRTDKVTVTKSVRTDSDTNP